MLLFLIFSALCQDVIVNTKPSCHRCRSLFDLRYFRDGKFYPMTRNNEGFYVAYKVYEAESAAPTRNSLLSYPSKSATFSNVHISFEKAIDPKTGYLTMKFKVQNNNNVDKKVDLGVFADSIPSDKNPSTITMRTDQKGFTITHTNSDIQYSLLIKGTNYQDVTNMAVFDRENAEKNAFSYPYWENTKDSSKKYSAYAFSWTDLLIKAGETKELGFIVVPYTTKGKSEDKNPYSKKLTEKKYSRKLTEDFNGPVVDQVGTMQNEGDYPRATPGDSIMITASIQHPNQHETIKIYAQIGSRAPEEVDIFGSSSANSALICQIEVPNGIAFGRYTVIISAEDSKGVKSKQNKSFIMEVYDPDNPTAPTDEIGDFKETTSELNPNSNSCFDIQYHSTYDDDGEFHRTTYNGEGYYVGYRLYNKEGNPQEATHLVKHSEGSQSTTNDITVKYFHEFNQETKYLTLYFNVTNNGYFPQKVDLSVFGDVDIYRQDDLKQQLTMRPDKRGFLITDGSVTDITFFTRDFSVLPSVDKMYLGALTTERAPNNDLPISDMPFFKEAEDNINDANIVISFSWMNRTIPPDTTVTFGFAAVPAENVRTPSIVKDETDKKDYYKANEEVTIKIRVEDGDIGDKINLDVNLNGTPNTESYTMKQDQKSYVFTKTVNVGNGPYYRYTAQASDDYYHMLSNKIDVILPINAPPEFQINEGLIKPKYSKGGTITIEGTVQDVDGGVIKYQFDDNRISELTTFEGSTTPQTINKQQLAIDSEITDPKVYTFKIWAEDKLGIKSSNKIQKEFTLIKPEKPHLIAAGFSTKLVRAGDEIIAFAVIQDEDVGNSYHLVAKFDQQGEFVEIAHSIVPAQLEPFAFYYRIPQLSHGNHDIEFKAKDSNNDLSDESIYLTIYVQAN